MRTGLAYGKSAWGFYGWFFPGFKFICLAYFMNAPASPRPDADTSSGLQPPAPHPLRRRDSAASPMRRRSAERESPLGRFLPNPKLRFLDQCREVIRFKRFSPRTEEAYGHWIRRFIMWRGKRHPKEMVASVTARAR